MIGEEDPQYFSLDVLFKNLSLINLNSEKASRIEKLVISNKLESYFIEMFQHSIEIKTKFHKIFKYRSLRSMHSLIVIADAKKLISKFNERSISFIPLKGIVMINKYYKNINNRPIRDIDILVEAESIKCALTTLHELGFKSDIEVDTDLNNEHLLRYHLPTLKNSNGVSVDIHIRIEDEINSNKIFTKSLLDNKVNKRLFDERVFLPNPEHLILHSIYHATKKQAYSDGCIFLMDIIKVFENNKVCEENLISISKKFGIFIELKFSINVIHEYYDKKIIITDKFDLKEAEILAYDFFKSLINDNTADKRLLQFFSRNFWVIFIDEYRIKKLEAEFHKKIHILNYPYFLCLRLYRQILALTPKFFLILFNPKILNKYKDVNLFMSEIERLNK